MPCANGVTLAPRSHGIEAVVCHVTEMVNLHLSFFAKAKSLGVDQVQSPVATERSVDDRKFFIEAWPRLLRGDDSIFIEG